MKSFSLFPTWIFRITFKCIFRNTQALCYGYLSIPLSLKLALVTTLFIYFSLQIKVLIISC